MTILVTGGAGFIGSHFVDVALKLLPRARIITVDKLTYAGNLENLIEAKRSPRHRFVRADIGDAKAMWPWMKRSQIVVNFAAETHVDRSIDDGAPFLRTNVIGVHTLVDMARKARTTRFIQVSTDEVYGPVMSGTTGEGATLRPMNPYAASKAAGEHLVMAAINTYRLPALITRGSNTFGPRQYPEKVLPVFIRRAMANTSLPVYGDGLQVRDWLYAEDHARGILAVLQKGRVGEVYNIGGDHWLTNLALAGKVLVLLGKSSALIQHVPDRPGHDRRYAPDTKKIRRLGWRPRWLFETALSHTVRWYSKSIPSKKR